MAPRQCRRDAGVCKKKVADRGERVSRPNPTRDASATNKITGHWGEDAVGFKWTEQDSVDNRLQQMDVGQFYSATIWTPKEMTLKGIAVRIGEKSEASILFDTELLRVVCGWSGEFLEFNPARYGIISPPKVGKEIVFHSPRQPGWSREGQFKDPRPKPFGPLPREWAKYRGLHLHGDRVVFEYTVGPKQVVVLESPWMETVGDRRFVTRELEIAPSEEELELLVAEAGSKVELVADAAFVKLASGGLKSPITAKVAAHNKTVRLKLLFPVGQVSNLLGSKKSNDGQVENLPHEGLSPLTRPGLARWTEQITTRGVVSKKTDALVADTLTLPFDNPYKALMFVGGHDFFGGQPSQADHKASPTSNARATTSDGRLGLGRPSYDAAVCTLHGDVWLVGGIDDKLEKLTWKRFATGLFQPLGLKIVKNQIYVVGRDQITRLHDLNGDGEADWYENFNNDGQVTTNGHEYVTCLETDSAGWFYFLKGNAIGETDHDGCLLRVSPDGQKLEVVATGFRNANGLGIGPALNGGQEILTVAPQEGEWTPGSAIFEVVRGGFHGYTPSAHRDKAPTEFIQPLCWIPRLQDNSCGGQVWVPPQHWGLLGGQMLHLSYGTSRMFLVPRETIQNEQQAPVVQGATIPLPLAFESGVMRGRFRSADGHLYVSGLRGWVSNAAQDGCLQRVRIANRLDLPVAMQTFRNGLLIQFSDPLDAEAAADIDNFRVQRWNYRWSAAYGSPEFKVSNPRDEGRNDVEVLSTTHVRNLEGGDTVFLELADMRPANQLSIQMTLRTTSGQQVERRLDATINAVRNQDYELERKPARLRPGSLTEAEQQRLVPGIRCEFVGQVENMPHVRRMAAWRIDRQELVRTREIVANGYLVAPRRGTYRLSAECRDATEVFIGDQVVWRSTDDKPSEVELVRGYNRLRIVQRVDPAQVDQPAALRLLWSGADFETEPIPPTSLFCEQLPEEVEALRLGRELFASHQCVRCHRVSDEILQSKRAMPELHAESSDLTGVGSRLHGDWIAKWVLNPKQMRSDARMPRLFPLTPTDEHRQQASDLAAYLTSLTETRAPSANGGRQPTVRLGRTLWEDLGCIGCHRLKPTIDEPPDGRTSLHFVQDKFLPGELTGFLRQPQRHFAWTRMPDFGLSDHEAASLAHLLAEPADGASSSPAIRPIGDVARGQKLFASLGCRQCHRVSRDEPLPKPHLPSVFGKTIARGCLAGQDQSHVSQSPNYRLKPAEQSALLILLRSDEKTLATDTPANVSRRFVADLQCAVCHPRDGRRNSLSEILADEGESGLPPEVVPNLTWVGEKLHSAWIQSLLAGQIAERPRPWMKLRMPSFPARARLLADGLAREHGLSSESLPRPSIQPDLVEIGEVLATRTGLLDCRQCHAIGPLPPTGDKNTLLAPGINFALTRERVRHDFYRRFTLDPPRYDVNTRMPKLVIDGRTTKVKNVFDGDARQQFEAVWHYLQTVPSSTADP